MKRIKIPKQANLQEDMLKAIRIYSRNNFGFQRGTITKNKKKYNRIQNKRELSVTRSSLYLFINSGDANPWYEHHSYKMEIVGSTPTATTILKFNLKIKYYVSDS